MTAPNEDVTSALPSLQHLFALESRYYEAVSSKMGALVTSIICSSSKSPRLLSVLREVRARHDGSVDDCHGWIHGSCANMDSTEAITLPHFSCSACFLRSVGAYLSPLPSQLQHIIKPRAIIFLSPPISTSLIAHDTSPLADPTSYLSLASSSLSLSTAVTLTQPSSLISCSPPGLFPPLPSSPIICLFCLHQLQPIMLYLSLLLPTL